MERMEARLGTSRRRAAVNVGVVAALLVGLHLATADSGTPSVGSVSADVPGTQGDEGLGYEVEDTENPAIVRQDTSDGQAAVELVVESDLIRVGETITFYLANHGEVPLTAGLGFEVERWDGQGWSEFPPPQQADGQVSAVPAIGFLVDPGTTTEPQRWPEEPWEMVEAGRYRLVKDVSYERPNADEPDVELTVAQEFAVHD